MAVRDTSGWARTQIDARTSIGAVRLTVRDLERSTQFYEQLLGMCPAPLDDSQVALSTASGEVLVELTASASAAARDPRQTGLFHFALMFPSRRDLGVALVRLASGGWPLSGASDHLVSEALYLDDPDGNGIELYADRPRSSWPFTRDGEIEMDTLPLDFDDLIEELEFEPLQDAGRDRVMPQGTRMGHVHLQVASIPEVEEFYVQLLGFEVMAKLGKRALFVSAGRYHHHIGMNTWNSQTGAAPAADSVGLRSFDVLLPDERALNSVLRRVSGAGLALVDEDGGALIRDPCGNALVLRAL